MAASAAPIPHGAAAIRSGICIVHDRRADALWQGAVVLIPHAKQYLKGLSAEDVLIHFFDLGYNDVLQKNQGLFSESALVLVDADATTLRDVFVESLYNGKNNTLACCFSCACGADKL